MRLVTWNARRGRFARKAPLLDHLNADIAVVQEISAPLSESAQTLWFGDNVNQGVAVIAREPYTIRRLPELPDVPKYVIPIEVQGPISFVLFAVWTVNRQLFRYVRAVSTAIDLYANVFTTSPVVLLGDFNSNAIWDKKHPASLNHTSMVERLSRLDLVSAYHHIHRVEHGSELEHTFHLFGHEHRHYHIDYCFLPRSWSSRIERVVIGSYSDWKEHSDHRPLTVELRDDGG